MGVPGVLGVPTVKKPCGERILGIFIWCSIRLPRCSLASFQCSCCLHLLRSTFPLWSLPDVSLCASATVRIKPDGTRCVPFGCGTVPTSDVFAYSRVRARARVGTIWHGNTLPLARKRGLDTAPPFWASESTDWQGKCPSVRKKHCPHWGVHFGWVHYCIFAPANSGRANTFCIRPHCKTPVNTMYY